MGFREVNFSSLARFNSAVSSKFISFYENAVIERLQSEGARTKSRTFAPSCLRCERKSWFRLRGTQPDFISSPDLSLNFMAEIGTAIHQIIQQNLKNALGDDWIDVEDYLNEHPMPYKYTLERSGFETKVQIEEPPIKFACDGIIRFQGKLYLLEIKSSEYSSWERLMNPKDVHMAQIKAYAALLGLRDVLVLYVDRQYGGLKCYEEHIADYECESVFKTFETIQHMAEVSLAPPRIRESDYLCTNCEYKEKCKEWG